MAGLNKRARRIVADASVSAWWVPPSAECYRLARKFRHTLWDRLYLECAQQNGATFWTADERLYNGVKDELPWVKWIGDYPLKRRRRK